MNVGHILGTKGAKIFAIAPDQPLTVAVDLMMRHRVGSLAVMDGEDLVSIVTERDVMRSVNRSLARFSELRVRDVMAPKLICCQSEDGIDSAMALLFNNELEKRIRHLPVKEGDKLVGIISIGDLVQSLLTEIRFENKLLRSYIKNWPEAEEA